MFPIQDTIPSRNFPLVNYCIIGVNLMVFLFELSLNENQLQEFFYLFGMVPARYSHPEWAQIVYVNWDNYWPFLTNMFLHGGWAHFIGNMWTLWIFGDNVEDRMGGIRYLVFYILCGLIATSTHYYLNIGSQVPALGASGAISGVMAAYMFMYPHSRIIFLIPIFFIPYFIELSAFVYIGFWFLIQLFSGTYEVIDKGSNSEIAFWAHIGGFVGGFLIYRLFLRKLYKRNYKDDYIYRYRNYH